MGCIFAIIILIEAGFFGFVTYKEHVLKKESQFFVDTVAPIIFADWNAETLYPYLGKSQNKEENVLAKVRSLFEQTKAFGRLKKYNGSKGDVGYAIALRPGDPSSIWAAYFIKADFENGRANISLTLSKNSGEWKIMAINIEEDKK